MYNTALNYIDEKKDGLTNLAMEIWSNPEVAFEEKKASKLIAEYLEKEGFEVEVGKFGLPTSIRASWGKGKPVIGLLGEYDALPGMSQKVSTKKEPVAEGAPGHACGHNLLGVGHVGAAIGIKKELEEKGLEGTVVFYGCPAEETLTGKGFMAREGAFRDLDIAFAWHPGKQNMVMRGTMTALDSFKFHFKGITAHAGGDPHNGRSALDAVELTDVGANYLREHVTSDVRIHYTITNGGQAPNIVPDKASVWYYVRALSREAVVDAFERLVKVAKGAAMMTETEVKVEKLGGCYNTLNNSILGDLIYDSMKEIPAPQWTEEEKDFVKEMEKPKEGKLARSGLFTGEPINMTMDNYGSTDVGDVQHIVPGLMFMTATSNLGSGGHSWENTSCSGNSIGMKGMIYASKVMANAALKTIYDNTLIERAKKEFNEKMKDKEYECPIAKDIEIPK